MQIERNRLTGVLQKDLDRADRIRLEVGASTDQMDTHVDRLPQSGDVRLAPLPGQRHGDHGHQLDIEDSLELPGDPQSDIEVLHTDRTADVQMAPHRGGATQQEPIEFLPDPLRHTFGIEPAGRLGLHPCLDSPSEVAGGVRGDLCRQCLVEMGLGLREGREEQSPADVHTWRLDSRGIDVVGDHHARVHEQVDSATVDHTVRDHPTLIHDAMVGVSDVPVATVPSVSRRFDDLSGPEVGDRITERSIILLPIGAVEQHGPHLPMSVDHVIAEEVATAVTDRVGDELDIWQLPTLSMSKSNEHAWSAGTIWLSSETLMSVLLDIGRAVATTASQRLVLLNGHGGNTTLLNTALREIRLATGLRTFLMHPSLPPAYGGTSTEDELGMGIHGGLNETSVFMHLRPDLVDLSKAARRVPEALASNRHVRFGGSVSFGWLSNDFHPDGYIGDPTGADPEMGRQLFEKAVESLCEAMREISTFDFGR